MYDHVPVCVGYNNTNLQITQRNTISSNNLNMRTLKAVSYALKNVRLPKCPHSSFIYLVIYLIADSFENLNSMIPNWANENEYQNPFSLSSLRQ